jgi:non-heme chloroperoxidase
MSTLKTKNITELYFMSSGDSPPVVFNPGYCLNPGSFEDQMFFMANQGYRCIAADH